MILSPEGDDDRDKENNERLLTPDIEEIKNYIKNDPQKRTANEILKTAGLCGVKKLRQWEKGGKAYQATLEALVRVLHGCEDVSQITKHPITTCPILDADDPKQAYEGIIIRSILSPEYLAKVNEAGGFDQVDIANFAWDQFRRDMLDLDISPRDQLLACRGMCRAGWLRESGSPVRPVFYLRPFTTRQQRTAHNIRNKMECLAIENLLDMHRAPQNDSDKSEFQDIMEHQAVVLKSMERATEQLREDPNDEKAMQVIRYDCQFHLGWAGHDPAIAKSLELAIGHHLQPILRLHMTLSLLQLKDGTLPKGSPTLAKLVDDFYDSAKKIFDCLTTTCMQVSSFDKVVEAVEEHSQSGYDYLDLANELSNSLRSQ